MLCSHYHLQLAVSLLLHYHEGQMEGRNQTHRSFTGRNCQGIVEKRLGGTCLINLCGGGETLLCPDLPKVAKALLEEGHYVFIVTNGTITKAFKEIEEFPEELRKRLSFKFSYHYLEQHRLKITELFLTTSTGCVRQAVLLP